MLSQAMETPASNLSLSKHKLGTESSLKAPLNGGAGECTADKAFGQNAGELSLNSLSAFFRNAP